MQEVALHQRLRYVKRGGEGRIQKEIPRGQTTEAKRHKDRPRGKVGRIGGSEATDGDGDIDGNTSAVLRYLLQWRGRDSSSGRLGI